MTRNVCLAGEFVPPMMSKRFVTLALAFALAAVACAPRRIPGTEIEDTQDTREIIGVMERYRSSLEAKDAEAILELVSPKFNDNAGTSNPADDLSYEALKTQLPERVAQLEDVKLDVNVRKIAVEGDRAQLVYYYNSSYRLPKLSSRPQSDSDLQMMEFERTDGKWRILSGI